MSISYNLWYSLFHISKSAVASHLTKMFFQVQELASTDILLCEMEMPPAYIIVSAKEFWRKNKKRKKCPLGF